MTDVKFVRESARPLAGEAGGLDYVRRGRPGRAKQITILFGHD
jgi:hypothetical protein